MQSREVTEQDFRMPEFRDAKVEDYEFRADGKLVRKDRWERAIGSIRFLVGLDGREFEISDVVDAVRKLVLEQEGWMTVAGMEKEDFPRAETVVSLRLRDGGVLRNATCVDLGRGRREWIWKGHDFTADVVEWREDTPRA